MTSNNKQAKRRLKQLGATLNPSKAGWSDSEDEDLVKEGKTKALCIHINKPTLYIVGIKSVRIGDVVMQVYPAKNPELVPEIQGPFYDGSQVSYFFL